MTTNNPRRVILSRHETSHQGTFGTLATDSGFKCYTGELPDNGNAPQISCIPTGVYPVLYVKINGHWKYMLQNVPHRTSIEIHAGNYCGEPPWFDSDVLGCILLGRSIGYLRSRTSSRYQKAVIDSKACVETFYKEMAGCPFELQVHWESNYLT